MIDKKSQDQTSSLGGLSGPVSSEFSLFGSSLTDHIETVAKTKSLSADDKALMLSHVIDLKSKDITISEAAALCFAVSSSIHASEMRFPERLLPLEQDSLRLLAAKLKAEPLENASNQLIQIPMNKVLEVQRLNAQIDGGSKFLADVIQRTLASYNEEINIEDLPGVVQDISKSHRNFSGLSKDPLFVFADRVHEVRSFLSAEQKIEALSALSEAGIYRKRLFTDALKDLEAHYADIDGHHLAKLAGALSKSNPHAYSAIERIVDEFNQMPEHFSASQSIEILHAALNLRAGQGQVEAAAARIVNADINTRPGALSSDELTKFIWACSFSGMDHLADRAWRELGTRDPQSISPRESRYLLQACIVAGREMPLGISDRIHAAAYPDTPGQNQFEEAVHKKLKCIKPLLEASGYDISISEQEWILGFPADFLLEAKKNGKQKLITIECDGINFHKLGRSADGIALGKDVMKDLSRKIIGLEVVRIPSSDWETLERHEDRMEYLLERIRPKLPK